MEIDVQLQRESAVFLADLKRTSQKLSFIHMGICAILGCTDSSELGTGLSLTTNAIRGMELLIDEQEATLAGLYEDAEKLLTPTGEVHHE